MDNGNQLIIWPWSTTIGADVDGAFQERLSCVPFRFAPPATNLSAAARDPNSTWLVITLSFPSTALKLRLTINPKLYSKNEINYVYKNEPWHAR